MLRIMINISSPGSMFWSMSDLKSWRTNPSACSSSMSFDLRRNISCTLSLRLQVIARRSTRSEAGLTRAFLPQQGVVRSVIRIFIRGFGCGWRRALMQCKSTTRLNHMHACGRLLQPGHGWRQAGPWVAASRAMGGGKPDHGWRQSGPWEAAAMGGGKPGHGWRQAGPWVAANQAMGGAKPSHGWRQENSMATGSTRLSMKTDTKAPHTTLTGIRACAVGDKQTRHATPNPRATQET